MKDITRPYMVRLHKKHRDIIRKSAKLMKTSEAKFIRFALEMAELYELKDLKQLK